MKVIWFYWEQGRESMPPVIRSCFRSWVRFNPDWKVVFLDRVSIRKQLENLDDSVFLEKISVQHRSDYYRLLLLERYGGVWADATTFCTKSLDTWLPFFSNSGIFLFRSESRWGSMQNWFIYSEPGNPLIKAWRLKFEENVKAIYEWDISRYGIGRRFSYAVCDLLFRNRSIGKTRVRLSRLWLSTIVSRILRISCYFYTYILFDEVLTSHSDFRSLWKDVPILSDSLCCAYVLPNDECPCTVESKIRAGFCPMLKLTYRYKNDHSSKRITLFDYLEDLSNSLVAQRDSVL